MLKSMVGTQISNILNYPLFHEIPHRWKICRIHARLKEEGYHSVSPDTFNFTLFRFYEKRSRDTQIKFFNQLFGLNLSPSLREEFSLNYSDIEVNSKRVDEIAREVMQLLLKSDDSTLNQLPFECVKASLNRMYRVAHYSKVSQFYFSDFQSALLAEARKIYENAEVQKLRTCLKAMDPDSEFSELAVPSHSLTLAELDWLQAVILESGQAKALAFPDLKGSSVKSDADYPAALQPLLKTTRLYEAKLSQGEELAPQINQKIRASIGEKARKILEESLKDTSSR